MKTLAIIVNYKSAALTQQAVHSVLDSSSLGPVQVLVVDNSEDNEEAERLRVSLPSAVILLVSPENIGFGRACNLASDQFEGEQILLINPDARLLPGCLIRLQRTLSSTKGAGAVSSHIFWDEGLKFYLPSSYPLPLFELQPFLDLWGSHFHISRLLSALWRYHSIKVWRSKRPVRVKNLSGGLVLLKRAAVKKAGGLFDPRFFLYFEDTDLFIRMRKAGYTLLVEPRAGAIHYYNQCGQGDWKRKRALMARSYLLLSEKYRRPFHSLINGVADHFKVPVTGKRGESPQPDFISPFVLKVPASLHKGWLFEVSPNPNFIPCAARFGKGPLMDFPEECWTLLAPGRYFGRIGYPTAMGKCVKEVTWVVAD